MRCVDCQGLDWVWEMLKLALAPAVAENRHLPRLLFYEQLDNFDTSAWLGFEAVLVVHDRCVRFGAPHSIFPSGDL